MNGARRAETGEPTPGEESGEGASLVPTHLNPVKRVLLGVAGGLLVLVGVALLVLPGPGLLLVLAGLVLLSRAVPAVARFVGPVRDRAMLAAEGSVATPWRIAGTVLGGLALVATGVALGVSLWEWLPFTGWSTGGSLILSGLIVFALLVWSYRRVHGPHRARD